MPMEPEARSANGQMPNLTGQRSEERRPKKYEPYALTTSIFQRSLIQKTHPLDAPLECGFKPAGKPLKDYREHIAKCSDNACRERYRRWLELVKELSVKRSRAVGA
jgi:hypothetical protein